MGELAERSGVAQELFLERARVILIVRVIWPIRCGGQSCQSHGDQAIAQARLLGQIDGARTRRGACIQPLDQSAAANLRDAIAVRV
jgi:hypothetical protein